MHQVGLNPGKSRLMTLKKKNIYDLQKYSKFRKIKGKTKYECMQYLTAVQLLEQSGGNT